MKFVLWSNPDRVPFSNVLALSGLILPTLIRRYFLGGVKQGSMISALIRWPLNGYVVVGVECGGLGRATLKKDSFLS